MKKINNKDHRGREDKDSLNQIDKETEEIEVKMSHRMKFRIYLSHLDKMVYFSPPK